MSSVQPILDHGFLEEAHLPYSLLGSLGHGGSGTVDEVRHTTSHEVYARKTIRITGLGFGRTERTRSTFQNEVDIIRRLERHSHIIRVHATYYTKRNFGILLGPVASDGDLEEFIDEYYGAVEANAATKLAAMTAVMEQAFGCLAAGLAFMHSRRIRHKDIKTRNILVHNGRMIYTDFGYSFDSNGFTHSASGGVAEHFTRRYSCPEVLAKQPRNSRSDVFSLGCVFIDMFSALTGHGVPVPTKQCFADNIEQLHQLVLGTEVSSRLEALPRIIVRMTNRNSSDRPRSTDAAAELLEKPHHRCSECASSPIENWKVDVQHESLNVPAVVGSGSMTAMNTSNVSSLPLDETMLLAQTSGERVENRATTNLFTATAQHVVEARQGDMLDSRYFIRNGAEATEFFQQGRVFSRSVVVNEPMPHRPIDTSRSENSPLHQLRGHSTTHPSQQRLVVVKVHRMNQYVSACEIRTYNDRGTQHSNWNASKHAVVYMTGTQPVYLDGERENGMVKEPIEIDLVDQSIRYEPSSRLNFGKVFNIDFNTEVRNHGCVIQDHMSKLIGYYRYEHQDGLERTDE